MSDRRSSSHSESVATGVLGFVVLLLVGPLIAVAWLTAFGRAIDSSPEGVPEPPLQEFIDPAERRATIMRAAAAVLTREHTPSPDGAPELVVVDVRAGERWAWWSRGRTFDSGGRATWRAGTLPDASLPMDGAWHRLWSDEQLALEWQNGAGTLVVREVRAPGAAVALRTMVSHARSFSGFHIPAGDLHDNAIYSSATGAFVPDRWSTPLSATLLLDEHEGELVLDLTFGR